MGVRYIDRQADQPGVKRGIEQHQAKQYCEDAKQQDKHARAVALHGVDRHVEFAAGSELFEFIFTDVLGL